jgi:hypothetical protein
MQALKLRDSALKPLNMDVSPLRQQRGRENKIIGIEGKKGD